MMSASRNGARRKLASSSTFCLALGLAVLATIAAAQAPEPGDADWKAMHKNIAEQRAALIAGDGKRAFGYASPGIRAQFVDAQTFMAMVRTAYAPLLTARYVEFLQGAVIDGTVIVPLRLVDGDATVRVALYSMERQSDGTWRIAGCRIAPSTVQST
jgi:hypothetical protein